MKVFLVLFAFAQPWGQTQGPVGSAESAKIGAEQPAVGTELRLDVVQGHLVVPVRAPDGTMLRFMVSSGTGQTILAQSVVDRFGAGAALYLGEVAIDERRVTWPDEELALGEAQLDGRLGVSTLGDYDVLIDVPGGRMVLGAIGSAASWPGLSDPVRVRVMHGSALMLDVDLGGHTYPAIIDLATRTVVVNEGVQRDLSLGDAGAAPLTIGARTIEDVPIQVMALDVFEMWSPDGDGVAVIGAAPFMDCPVSLSWARAEIRTCQR